MRVGTQQLFNWRRSEPPEKNKTKVGFKLRTFFFSFFSFFLSFFSFLFSFLSLFFSFLSFFFFPFFLFSFLSFLPFFVSFFSFPFSFLSLFLSFFFSFLSFFFSFFLFFLFLSFFFFLSFILKYFQAAACECVKSPEFVYNFFLTRKFSLTSKLIILLMGINIAFLTPNFTFNELKKKKENSRLIFFPETNLRMNSYLLIDFNGMSTRPELIYIYMLRNRIHCTSIFTIFV